MWQPLHPASTQKGICACCLCNRIGDWSIICILVHIAIYLTNVNEKL